MTARRVEHGRLVVRLSVCETGSSGQWYPVAAQLKAVALHPHELERIGRALLAAAARTGSCASGEP